MLTVFSKGDWLQFREQNGAIHRGILYVKECDVWSYEINIMHCPTLKKVLGMEQGPTLCYAQKEQCAPDKKFKLPVSRDDNSSHEQKLRDNNLHWWLSGAGICSRPYQLTALAIAPSTKTELKWFCRARDIPSQHNLKLRAQAFIRLTRSFNAPQVGMVFVDNGVYPEYEILETILDPTKDSDVWWSTKHRPGLGETWYKIKLIHPMRGSNVGYIHNSRVDLFQKEV